MIILNSEIVLFYLLANKISCKVIYNDDGVLLPNQLVFLSKHASNIY